LRRCGGRLLLLKTGDSDNLSRWCYNEEFAAGFAGVVGVDAIVGLLLPDELEGFVPAFGQCRETGEFGIYAFGEHLLDEGFSGGAGLV